MTYNTIKIWICQDCLIFYANGDLPEAPEDAGAVEQAIGIDPGWSVVPGSDHKDCEHGEDGDCPEDEGSFSWFPCAACRRPLGGTRYPAMMMQYTGG